MSEILVAAWIGFVGGLGTGAFAVIWYRARCDRQIIEHAEADERIAPTPKPWEVELSQENADFLDAEVPLYRQPSALADAADRMLREADERITPTEKQP